MSHGLIEWSLVAALWATYCLLHSLLASLAAKRWFASHLPAWAPWYRILFNLLALLLLIPPLWLTIAVGVDPLWRIEGPWRWLNLLVTLAVAALFLVSLRYYDGAEFIGTRQLRQTHKGVEEPGALTLSPLHRYVRHPWYTLALVLVWYREMDPAMLVAAVVITLYLVIGSRLEERKLIACHGERYRHYRERVPGLIPLPWRSLDAEQARQLQREWNPPPRGSG